MFIQAKTLLTKKLNYDHHHHHHNVENEKKNVSGSKINSIPIYMANVCRYSSSPSSSSSLYKHTDKWIAKQHQ